MSFRVKSSHKYLRKPKPVVVSNNQDVPVVQNNLSEEKQEEQKQAISQAKQQRIARRLERRRQKGFTIRSNPKAQEDYL